MTMVHSHVAVDAALAKRLCRTCRASTRAVAVAESPSVVKNEKTPEQSRKKKSVSTRAMALAAAVVANIVALQGKPDALVAPDV